MAPAHLLYSPFRSLKMNLLSLSSTTLEPRTRLADSVGEEEQSSAVEVNEEPPNEEEHEVDSSAQDNPVVEVSNKDNTTTIEADEVREAEDSDGETTTNHNETEMLQSTFDQTGK